MFLDYKQHMVSRCGLLCISLVSNVAKNLFSCMLTILVSSFVKYLVRILAQFKKLCRISKEEYFLDINALPGVCMYMCVGVHMRMRQSQVFFFFSLNSVVHWMEFLNLSIKSNLSIFCCVLFKKLWPTPKSWKYFLCFLLESLLFYFILLSIWSILS